VAGKEDLEGGPRFEFQWRQFFFSFGKKFSEKQGTLFFSFWRFLILEFSIVEVRFFFFRGEIPLLIFCC
jgi:hypothetical protein